MRDEIYTELGALAGFALTREDLEEFFKGWGMDGNIMEPEKLPPLSGPVTLKDGTVIAPKPKRGAVLQEAITTINGERQDVYGSPEDSFRHIADYWNVYLGGEAVGIKIDAQDVAMMMTLFKVARIANGSAHRDSYVDAAGYIGLAADMCCEVKDV